VCHQEAATFFGSPLARIIDEFSAASANCTSSRVVLAPRHTVQYACVAPHYARPDLTHSWRFRDVEPMNSPGQCSELEVCLLKFVAMQAQKIGKLGVLPCDV
jgi:hypothetical protein